MMLTLAAFAVAISVLVAAYHLLLGAVAIVRRPRPLPAATSSNRFAILIPAHNEEACLSNVVASCHAQDYPPSSFEVFVIADNCSDSTASVATRAKATCLERIDCNSRGKGNALAWGIEQTIDQGFDAILVVDADCTLDANALSALNERLLAGQHAVQLRNVPNNADACAVSYLLAVANTLENDYFYRPKDMLGMAVFLRGTGMMLSTQVLTDCPWRAFSRAEDAEYTVRLLAQGYRVHFESRAAVRSAAPVQRTQLSTQRRRWVGGQLDVALGSVWSLLKAAGCKKDFRLLDAAWTGFIVLRIVVLCILAAAVALAGASALLVNDGASRTLLAIALASAAMFAIYVVIGVIALGVTTSRIKLLAGAVLESARYVVLSMRACFSREKAWNRTER